MPLSRRAAVATAALVTSALALAACGSSGGSDGPGSASGKVAGRVTFQTWSLKANFKDYFDGVIAAFEKKYPDAQVTWVDQPAEGYPEKLSADTAGGTLPDVVNVSPDLAYPLARAGFALDLEKAAGKYRGEYLDGAWQSYRMPGMAGVQAFPWYLNTGPMFYNRELFRKAGLDPAKPPASYDQLFQDTV